ncbi:MAG: NADH-quinone oxidoreductase subunit NuoH [Chloroflexi bacterium]|nr:NADH-quinone oxidoreductase subunit NuoH [Chloroflexota bacterium]
MVPGPLGLDPFVWLFLRLLIAVVLALVLILNGALVLIYLERKIQATMQDRIGPYHVGPFGLLQTFADALKLIAKEDFRAGQTDTAFFIAAPALVFSPMLASFVVIPFAPGIVGADLNIGLLYLATLGSMGVLGIVIAGWASNNKYSLVGGLRSAGQLISYEVPGILSLVTAVLVVGSLSMVRIAESQPGPFTNIFVIPLAFVTYFIAALAETNRTPFDLPEAESELVAGYLTEYSGMRWGTMLALTEYGNVTIVCAIMSTLWFGGWQGPGVDSGPVTGPVLGLLWFTLKTYAFILVFMWIRATLPRLRIDQLMSFCWKLLIPLTLLNLAVTATLLIAFPETKVPVAIANWILLGAFVLGLPLIQQRRLRRIRARLRERTIAAAPAS